MRVLVTGGAGYIGSIVGEELMHSNHEVTVYDNLYKGHRAAVIEGASFVKADLADAETLRATLKRYKTEAVIHMAADSLVGESMQAPNKFYRNNLIAGLVLLDTMIECGVRHMVFSSTAAVYGEPQKQPIEESDPTEPTNPYGESKLAFERALRWYAGAYGLRHTSLRYFNAAGASKRFGEAHNPESHLIPLLLHAAAGKTDSVQIYGDDYPTPDGTCVRDYVHVTDLARAHILALENPGEWGRVYNLGCGGDGYSVLQVIKAACEVTGRDIPRKVVPRRAGDPSHLVASSERIRRELNWKPVMQDLQVIIGSAWDWMQKHPDGYPD